MTQRQIFQLYYDEASRQMLSPHLTPLDNVSSPRAEWFEFWPIRRFLLGETLQDEAWYGFLSPKFERKFGIEPGQVLEMVDAAAAHEDVLLLSPHWDQGAYFLNAFEQGDFWTPGLLEVAQQFVDAIGMKLQLRELVAHSRSTVFSNYFVANGRFWSDWLQIANQLFEHSERPGTGLSAALNRPTGYGVGGTPVLMKVFLQERLACLLLSSRRYRVGVIDLSDAVPLTSTLFPELPVSRRKLQACDLMKQQYEASGDADYLDIYWKLRLSVPTLQPVSAGLRRESESSTALDSSATA